MHAEKWEEYVMDRVVHEVVRKSEDDGWEWMEPWRGGLDRWEVLVIYPHKTAMDPAKTENRVLLYAVKVK